MTEREALNMALQALETLMIERGSIYDKAITAIKEALAQPEQEPVACVEYIPCCPDQTCPKCKATTPPPRTWVGLSDEEMHACWDSPLTPLGMKHARMIEAKLKEKTT